MNAVYAPLWKALLVHYLLRKNILAEISFTTTYRPNITILYLHYLKKVVVESSSSSSSLRFTELSHWLYNVD